MVDLASEFIPVYNEVCQKVSTFLGGADNKEAPE